MPTRIKQFRIVLLTLGAVLIYLTYRTCYVTNTRRERETFRKRNSKSLLYWSAFWGQSDYFMGLGYEGFKNCEYSNCYATDNRNFIPIEEFDALMFHDSLYNNYNDSSNFPWSREPRQMYIYVNMEAPTTIVPNLKPYMSFFNWTMTYRFDSDIRRSYAFVVNVQTNYTTPSTEFVKNKTRIAAWFVSHCETSSKREELTKQIQRYIPVDVYGDCGDKKCARKSGSNNSPVECYDMVEKNYKFYFSFENSYCVDYTTEKLYNILRRDIVPVVYGGSDYKVSAPPHSVINAADFASAKELTDYLKYLDENPDEYLKYFEWKKMFIIADGRVDTACHICKKLHEPLKPSIYHNLHRWWWGENNNMCKVAGDLPKIVKNKLLSTL